MEWTIKDEGFRKEDIDFWGSKYLIGNGYMGYRGTLEEYGREQRCACTLAGIYDKNGDKWREPINMPNPFWICVTVNGEALSVLEREPVSHRQELDMKTGRFLRTTEFQTSAGICSIHTERFLSRKKLNLMAMQCVVDAAPGAAVQVEVKLDRDIWDINGPHLEQFELYQEDTVKILTAKTREQKRDMAAGQMLSVETEGVESTNGRIHAVFSEDGTLLFCIYGWIGKDAGKAEIPHIVRDLMASSRQGYASLLDENTVRWKQIWDDSDVEIDGDKEMEQAVRYSLYQLISSAPFHTDDTAIPARGLSGQVYKGAMFWDTELFMLPFFTAVLPDTARNLVRYRIRTLEGAKRKARALGFQGAFYAWESQDTGDEACTKYGFTDVFTGRPIRTYFGDKQIHISADVAYGIWKYYQITGDWELLLDGGLETITECIRFLYDYSVFKDNKNQYELHDVTSPDEYHERNNNDAYTNILTKEMANIMLALWEEMAACYPEEMKELKQRLLPGDEYERLRRFARLLYVPQADKNGVIEQCDGYFALEDVSVEELLERKLTDTEYLGGVGGIASSTQIIKQADVVLATMLFKEHYSREIRETNWKYYELRTEHGSSLSACIYALGAIDSGDLGKAYRYLEKTAYIDLRGDYKCCVGDLYIGGVHTAANGGAWMVTVQGFAGLCTDERGIHIAPKLPEKWNKVKLIVFWMGQRVGMEICENTIRVCADAGNTGFVPVHAFGRQERVAPGVEANITRSVL